MADQADDGNLLVFRRGQEAQDSGDIWDDTALIEAYDLAVGEAKEEIKRRNSSVSLSGSNVASSSNRSQSSSNSQKRKHRSRYSYKNKPRQWKAGDACRAVYSVDGILYEAFIDTIDWQDTKSCRVVFVGYGNVEDVAIADLLPSKGKQSRRRQTREAEAVGLNAKVESLKVEEDGGSNVDPVGNGGMDAAATNDRKRPHSAQQQSSSQSYNWPIPPMGSMPPPPPPPPFEDGDEDSEALATMLLSWYMSGYHTGYYQAQKRYQNANPGLARKNI